jgi:putative redox protein
MDRAVAVRTVPGERFRASVAVGPHLLAADEPAAAGGGDAGPAPFELLAAALGACTTMTLRMYADRKGWPLREVAVTVERVRREGAAPENLLRRRVRLEGDLDAGQRARLLEIAGKCPVHRALEGGVAVETAADQ